MMMSKHAAIPGHAAVQPYVISETLPCRKLQKNRLLSKKTVAFCEKHSFLAGLIFLFAAPAAVLAGVTLVTMAAGALIWLVC